MFASETELKCLVDTWSDCSLPAKDWTHSAHIATCSYLAWNNTLAQTYLLMRAGLHRFNEATGVPNSDTRGYHETLTRFWVTVVFFTIHRSHFHSCLDAANGMVAQFGKNSRADRAYYSFDVLASMDARRIWIAPDKQSVIARESFHW